MSGFYLVRGKHTLPSHEQCILCRTARSDDQFDSSQVWRVREMAVFVAFVSLRPSHQPTVTAVFSGRVGTAWLYGPDGATFAGTGS